MSIIDQTTSIGKLRLRVADYSDLPYLPDSVYESTLADNNNNLTASATIIATYILGMLAHKTHRKMGVQLEVWGAEAFSNYKQFLLLTVKDPSFMQISPVAYNAFSTTKHPLIQFQEDWNRNYAVTQSQQLASSSLLSPNDGSRYGVFGTGAAGSTFAVYGTNRQVTNEYGNGFSENGIGVHAR